MEPKTLSFTSYIKFLFLHYCKRRKAEIEKKRCEKLLKHGYWYCAHCNKIHPPRVVEYEVLGGELDSVCSVGKLEYLAHDPTLMDDEIYFDGDFKPFVKGLPFSDK